MNKRQHLNTLLMAAALAAAAPAHAASLMATYDFNNSFAANQPGMAATVPVNPLGANQFQSATVFGQPDTVYRFQGNASPALQQAGLQLNTTGMFAGNDYSVEMIFSLDTISGYRRLLAVDGRTADNGFYVLSNHLTVFPTGGSGPNLLTAGAYHHVILTVAPSGSVHGYIDGLTDFTTTTSVMNITSSGQMLDFFLDNALGGPSQSEYSSGSIARLNVYQGALTAPDALALFNSQVPEPGSAALLGLGAACGLRRRRRA